MPGRLFRVRGLVVGAITMFAMMVSYGGYLFSVALHLQTGLGYSPLQGRAHLRADGAVLRCRQPQLASAAGPLAST